MGRAFSVIVCFTPPARLSSMCSPVPGLSLTYLSGTRAQYRFSIDFLFYRIIIVPDLILHVLH